MLLQSPTMQELCAVVLLVMTHFLMTIHLVNPFLNRNLHRNPEDNKRSSVDCARHFSEQGSCERIPPREHQDRIESSVVDTLVGMSIHRSGWISTARCSSPD
ncbi:hypothetical protein BDD12DRAFT_839155 [Trichophaea hybrida]|nr:hypothetical protein BDD12DRAFT_839155 [Trichophaea hybrida]